MAGTRTWRALRAALLPVAALPLLPALFLALASGQGRTILGIVSALAGVGATVALLRRASAGDHRRAALLLGLGVGVAGWLSAGAGPVGGAVLGLLAGAGAWLAYDGLPERAPAAAPLTPADPVLAAFARRIAALRASEPRFGSAALALDNLLNEVARRPALAIGEARTVLVVGLDGLERVGERLARGAEPHAALPDAVADVERAAAGAVARLRGAETEALDIQLRVLRERLKEEGVA